MKQQAYGGWEAPAAGYRAQARPPRRPSRPEGMGASLAKLLVPLLAPLLFVLLIVPTGYILEGPGPAFDLQEDLTVEGAQTYPYQGKLMLTSVSLQESRLVFNLLALFDREVELMRIRDYLGEDLDTGEQETVDAVITILSENTAVVAGLRDLGVPVEVDELGVFVVETAPGFPAFGVVDPGEVIVGVDGEPALGVERFKELIGAVPDGGTATLQLRRVDGELVRKMEDEAEEEDEVRRTDPAALLEEGVREVEIQPVYDAELEAKVIGVALRDYFSYSSQVEVGWDLASVRGPSAGLMMTLSLLNALTPEDLTGGRKIAGTGEIFLDGDVGPIGGLPFKIRAAEKEGVEVFIYPVENRDDLDGFSTSLELYAVEDLAEAVEILRRVSRR